MADQQTTAVRIVQIVVEPIRLLAMVPLVVVRSTIAAVKLAVRPVLYTVGALALLAVGAVGGYGFSLYQTVIAQQHPVQVAAEAEAPAPTVRDLEPLPSRPTLPEADAFGLKQ